MSELLIWTAYKAQSEIVGREKVKLRELNGQLLAARKTCEHAFHEGVCTKCGQNEEAYRLLNAPPVPRPTGPEYKFVD